MDSPLIRAIGLALELWNRKDKRKYIDCHIDLKRQWNEEYNRPEGERSRAELDRIKSDLCVLLDSIAAAAGEPDA